MKDKELIAVFLPDGFAVREAPSNDKDGYFDQVLLDSFLQDKPHVLHRLGFALSPQNMSPSLSFLHRLSQAFSTALAGDGDIELSRMAKALPDETALSILHSVPFVLGLEHITIPWISARWDELSQVFEEEIHSSTMTVEEYLRTQSSTLAIAGRVFFHLVEYRDDEYPFAFLATYSTGSGKNISHLPLKNALTEYSKDRERLLFLLKTVGKVCDKSTFVSELSESGELFSPLRFTKEEAYTFLREVPLYEESGIVCRIPDWWKKKYGAVVKAKVGENPPAQLGLEALLSFSAELCLDDLELTREEVEELLAQTSGLSFLKGKWVEVDHEKLAAALAAFDQIASLGDISFAKAMRLQLGLSQESSAENAAVVAVENGQWLKILTEQMKNASAASPLSAGADFHATLRHYQQIGLNWLGLMRSLGFGALLADDMGLGKTVQILALLEHMRENGGGKTLLLMAASLRSFPICFLDRMAGCSQRPTKLSLAAPAPIRRICASMWRRRFMALGLG